LVTLPPKISSLDGYGFSGCSSLSSVTIGARVFENCSFLTSVHLPTNLTAISLLVFEGCSKLTAIKASSFSTTTFSNSPGEFEDLLVKGGFSNINLEFILYGGDGSGSSSGSDMYYNMRAWGRKKDKNSYRLPLCAAAAKSLAWVDVKKIFAVNMPAIHDVDDLTGLPVFMLAGIGPTSDIESVYNLLKEYPTAGGLMNNNHLNALTGTTRKIEQGEFIKNKCQKL